MQTTNTTAALHGAWWMFFERFRRRALAHHAADGAWWATCQHRGVHTPVPETTNRAAAAASEDLEVRPDESGRPPGVRVQ